MTTIVGRSPNMISFCKAHSHSCWEIVIPVFGEGILETTDEKIAFKTKSVYVIPPNITHTTYSQNSFSDIYIRTDFLKLEKNKLTVLYDIEEMPFLANIIYNSYLKKYQGSLKCTLDLIVQIIYEHLGDKQNTLAESIRNYLIDNASNCNFTMESLSEKFGYNKDYIRRIFKAEFKLTPMEYLNDFRVSQAKEILQSMPNYKIEQIAELCGFADQFYFSRFFKKHTGMSPVKFKYYNGFS